MPDTNGNTPTVLKYVCPIPPSQLWPCFIADIRGIGKPLSLAYLASSACSGPTVPNNFLPSLPSGPNIKGDNAAAPEFHNNAFLVA